MKSHSGILVPIDAFKTMVRTAVKNLLHLVLQMYYVPTYFQYSVWGPAKMVKDSGLGGGGEVEGKSKVKLQSL